MKKAFWWILGILLSPVLLFVVLTVLLYLPPVQNWAVDKVAEVASEKTGMQITVGHVNLAFPLDLSIDDFKMINEQDTIADMEHMTVDVQLWPLLKKRVVINELEITNTKLNTNGFVDAACVKGDFKRLSLTSKGIDLDKQTVEVNGAVLERAQLDVQLRDSVPEDTTTTQTLWKIHADSLTITQSDLALHLGSGDGSDDPISAGNGITQNRPLILAHMGELKVVELMADLGTPAYSVGSVTWMDAALRYNDIDMPQLSMQAGPITMVNDSVRVPRFMLKTPDSDLMVELDMPLSFTDSINPGKMRLKMDAQLGKKDMMPFLTSLPKAMQERWPMYPLTAKGSMTGNMDYMEFSDLDVSLPTAFAAKADGFVANLNDLNRLRADVMFDAQTQDLNFVMAALPRDLQRNYRIPNGMRAKGRVKADGADYAADVTLQEGGGMVKAKGTLNTNVMRYDLTAQINKLNLHHFMPRDSFYTVTADITAKGQGTDFFSPRTTMLADAKIQHLGYGHWNLDNLTAHADVRNGMAHADINSENDLMKGLVSVDALMKKQQIDATLVADIHEVDFYNMGLTEKPLSIGFCGHVDLNSDMKLNHMMSGLFNDLTISDSSHIFRPGDIGLLVKARPDTTYLRAQSGDFIVKLDASGDYERLMNRIVMLSDTMTAQFDKRIIDQPAIRRLLPVMKMHVESQRDNPIVTLLNTSQNIDFKTLLFDMSTSPEEGVNGKGYVHSLTMSDMRLDTINFSLTQRKDHLSFQGQVRNNKKNPQFVFNALLDGLFQERGATMGLRYYDADNRLGIRLGAKAEMVDSGISLHLMPERPTIGYKEFNLNKDNFVLLTRNNRVRTKIDLIADDGTGVKIYSEDSDPTALQDITISLNKVNLGEVSSVLPYYLPQMTGLLNGDYHVIQDAGGHFSMVSDMSVRNMTYEHTPIGNISTELVYLQKEDDAHALEARLMKDDVEIGLLTGTYYNKEDGRIDARFVMDHLPLSIANGFVPDQLFGLQGFGEGELTIKGTVEAPKVDGEIYLESSYLESIPYGVKLRFDNDPVRIKDSQLLLENFTVYAYNNNPLNIQGNVDFSDLDKVTVNLRMQARDYQIIGAEENPKSIAYGKAFVNMFARMSGPLDNLSMRGRLDVLGSTDMSYVLRDTPLTTDNQLNELVKFTDFSDTTQIVVERPPLNGFQMDMTIEVSKGAHIMAYMNTDHTNYIDLTGGGTLRMQYTPADNLQLRGRYTLSNGEMKYSLPVIPLKTFNIQDGSYIEFTGDPMNPTLNITATERMKATVSGTSGVGRSLDFDCGVKITRTLNDMGLEFTLDAPEDMALHSELQAMGTEQRGKLAVTMLTTGMYLADGNTGAFSMNSALSAFLNNEINSITGNALRTLDLSMGMDKTTDAAGNMHTDYSFKFAKRFMNNRLKITVGGKVSTGAELQQRNNSFFDNVSLEYRLDQTANKFITLFYQNNSYDWLDGYTQKYGGGFTWRRSLQTFWDIFRFKDTTPQPAPRNPGTPNSQSIPTDSIRPAHEKE
jgi:hypothetical protein